MLQTAPDTTRYHQTCVIYIINTGSKSIYIGINADVTDAGRTGRDEQQAKIELYTQLLICELLSFAMCKCVKFCKCNGWTDKTYFCKYDQWSSISISVTLSKNRPVLNGLVWQCKCVKVFKCRGWTDEIDFCKYDHQFSSETHHQSISHRSEIRVVF